MESSVMFCYWVAFFFLQITFTIAIFIFYFYGDA